MRFLLVDRIVACEPGRGARGWKNAALSEDYFEWHFPERPIVPGMLILEAFVQLAGWYEAECSGFERWFVLDRVRSAAWYAFAGPGDRIDLALEVLPEGDPGRRAFRGESRVGETRGALVEFEGVVVALSELDGAERARRAWEVLRVPAGPGAGGRA